jgi:hypothetical protein
MSEPGLQTYSVALGVVGPPLVAYWDATAAFNSARTMANLDAAIVAATNAANAINAHLGVLPGGQDLLNSVNYVLADLQAILIAAQALVELGNS